VFVLKVQILSNVPAAAHTLEDSEPSAVPHLQRILIDRLWTSFTHADN